MRENEKPKTGDKLHAAQSLFFPAAAIHAAIVLPLSVFSLALGQPFLPGLTNPLAHAHEMLFGYALAVVAGFLVNRIERKKLWLLFGLWLAARLSFLLTPQALLSHLANIAFASYFAAMAAPQFLTAAKKWRNRIFAPTIVTLSLALIAFHLGGWWPQLRIQSNVARDAVIVLALLMAFMGGRIIAPAVAGYLQTTGRKLEARVQPRLEAILLILLVCTVLTAVPRGEHIVTGVLLIAAAVVAGARLVRWRLWLCRQRADLLCLGVGYTWLVFGLALLGGSYFFDGLRNTVVLHAITVGALGTLTLTVMARKWTIKARQHPGSIRGLLPATGLIAGAAMLRLVLPYSAGALVGAALLWSGAFFLLLVIFARTGSQRIGFERKDQTTGRSTSDC